MKNQKTEADNLKATLGVVFSDLLACADWHADIANDIEKAVVSKINDPDINGAIKKHRDWAKHLRRYVGCLSVIQLRLEREDAIPAFGAFLRCEAQHDESPVILINVQALMSPELEYEDGTPTPVTRDDRKRMLITTLMHEFGHVLESTMRVPFNEDAIEAACDAWESQYAKQANIRS